MTACAGNWGQAAQALSDRYTADHWGDVVLANEETLVAVLKELMRVTDTPGGRGYRHLPEMETGRALLQRLTDPTTPRDYATQPLPEELAAIKAELGYSERRLAETLTASRAQVRRVLAGDLTAVGPATIRHYGQTLKDNEFYFIEARAHLVASLAYHVATLKPRLALDAIAGLNK